MAVRIAVDNTRSSRAAAFPSDTPEPIAQPYAAIDALLTLARRAFYVAAGCIAVAGLLLHFFIR